MAPHKSLTLKDKVDIINDIENGKKQCEVAGSLKLAKSTIQKIWSQRVKILKNHTKVSPTIKKLRPCGFPKTDAVLLKWFQIQRNQNFSISGPLLLEQAKQFASRLGEADFKASNGWLQKWKSRHNIAFRGVAGDVIVGDVEDLSDDVCAKWLTDVWSTLKKSYLPKDIFSLGETVLIYNLLPNKTMVQKDELCTDGKLSKERVAVLLCANADGTKRLKPVVIGKYENPPCFSFLKKSSLPVDYYYNSKSRITQDIFSDWLKRLDIKMRLKHRKIIILIDNCQLHKIKDKLHNIEVVSLPPNVKSKLQPMSQGIISETKKMYRTILLRKCSEQRNCNSEHEIDLLEGMTTLSLAWKNTENKTIKSCFSHTKIIEKFPESTSIEAGYMDTNEKDVYCQQLAMNKTTMEEYFLVDLAVVTHDTQGDDDVIMETCGEKPERGIEEVHTNGEDDTEIKRTDISTAEILKYINDLKIWIMHQDLDSKDAFAAIHSLEDFVLKAKE